MIDSIYDRGYPHNALFRLLDMIGAVCPRDHLSIGRWDDRATWRLDAKPEATPEQIAAAEAVMAAFDPWGLQAPATQGSDDELLPPATDALSAPPILDPESLPPAPVVGSDPGGDSGAGVGGVEDEAIEVATFTDSPGIMLGENTIDQRKSDLAVTVAAMARERMAAASDIVRNTPIADLRNKLMMGLASDADREHEAAYNRAERLVAQITTFADDLQRSIRDMDSAQLDALDLADAGWPS